VVEAATVLDHCVPPFLLVSEKSAVALAPLDRLIYLLNILLSLQELMLKFDFVLASLEPVREKVVLFLEELGQIVERSREVREEEKKKKNGVQFNSMERLAEKKLIKMAKTLLERASKLSS